jgi:KaiC/GvpD/RAD55 family RecA-like ATPase
MPWGLINRASFDKTGMDEGGITVLAGAPATGKTFFLINMVVLWVSKGVDVRALFLESNYDFYLERVMAVIIGDNRYIDDTFISDMSQQERSDIIKQHGPLMDAVMGAITIPKEGQEPTVEWICAWANHGCKDGADVFIVDPISAIEGGTDQWKQDKDFVRRFAKIIETHKRRAFFTTHTNGKKFDDNDPLACVSGGKAVSRFTNNVWLLFGCPPHDPFNGVVSMKGREEEQEWNRELVIAKARKGENGAGQKIAMQYYKQTCAFIEVGYIINGKGTHEDKPAKQQPKQPSQTRVRNRTDDTDLFE